MVVFESKVSKKWVVANEEFRTVLCVEKSFLTLAQWSSSMIRASGHSHVIVLRNNLHEVPGSIPG